MNIVTLNSDGTCNKLYIEMGTLVLDIFYLIRYLTS